MEKHHRFSIWYVLIGVWAVLILHNIIFSAFAIKVIPYSQFLELVKDKKVAEVAITSNRIQGRMVEEGDKPGQMFRTVRVDPDISGLLEEHQVTFKGEIESTSFEICSRGLCPLQYLSVSGCL